MLPLPAFTIFDVETTGLDPKKGHKIIELAGIRIEDGSIEPEENAFSSFVYPEREIPLEAKQIHKIQEEEVQSAPTIDQVLPLFLEYAKQSILIAHNAEFDTSFLEWEKQCCWGYIELPECLCTRNLSRALFPGEVRHDLDTVARRLGFSPSHRHRALPDVMLTAEVFLALLEKGSLNSLEEIQSLASIRTRIAA